jgi:energy-coupling factor transporter ATP-binding protein EcfA2
MYRVALVVGINTYSKLNSLKAAARDAEAIAKLLENLGFEVRRLPRQQEPDGRITVGIERVFLTQLMVAIKELLTPATPKNLPDTVLLYFSGHGMVNDITGEGFLAASDANPAQGNYGFSLRSLQKFLRDSKVKQQIVWLDCCYSGELLNLYEADPGFQGEVRDRCFIAAAYDEAFELLSGHSALTWVLLKALNPENYPGGWITNLSLVNYLNQQIKWDPQLKTIPQRPTYANFGGAIDFTLNNTPPPEPSLPLICPYKGLSYFDLNEEDPKNFYGRTHLVSRLLERVQRSNFLAVLGASGSGKSSVVRAGLLHELKQGLRISGSDQWAIRLFRPGPYPLERLAQSLVDSDSSVGQDRQLTQIYECFKQGGEAVGRFIQTMAAPRLVLAVDQFEEVFTQCQDDSQRQVFFECLMGALKHSNNKLCLILVMRSDALEKCSGEAYTGLADQFQEPHLVPVLPMNSEELEQAIAEPARRVGAEVEPNLLKHILRDMAGSSSTLPLLQYTLTELWQKRSGNRLTLAAYIELGGVVGTLENQANKVYDNELSVEEQETAKRLFLALTQDGAGDIHTRRTLPQQDLLKLFQPKELVERVVQKLTNRNLLVTSGWIEKSAGADQPSGTEPGETATVEVAHEELIRSWSRLRDWVNENRDARHKQQSIEKAAEEWRREKKKRDRAYLLQGIKLEAAEEYLETHLELLPLTPLAKEFIQVSREEEDARQQQELEQERQLREEAEARAAAEAKARESEQREHEVTEELQRQRLIHLEEQVEAEAKLKLEADRARVAAEKKTRYAIAAGGLAIFAIILILAFPLVFQKLELEHAKQRIRDAISNPMQTPGDVQAAINIARDESELEQRIELFRGIVQRTAQTPGSLSDPEKQEFEKLTKAVRDELVSLILQPERQQLQKLKEEITGDRISNALDKTYHILIKDYGVDFDGNKEISEIEANLLHPSLIQEIERIWRQNTDGKCGWYGLNPQTPYQAPECNQLNGLALIEQLFPDATSKFNVSNQVNAALKDFDWKTALTP